MTLCPKHTRAKPCAGEVAVVVCECPPRATGLPCPDTYRRCAAHGGEAGARRSLASHRAIYHPKGE